MISDICEAWAFADMGGPSVGSGEPLLGELGSRSIDVLATEASPDRREGSERCRASADAVSAHPKILPAAVGGSGPAGARTLPVLPVRVGDVDLRGGESDLRMGADEDAGVGDGAGLAA